MTFTVCSCTPLWVCGSVFAYWLHAGCWPFADKAWASAGASCGQLILPLAVMAGSRSRPRGPLGICPTQLRQAVCVHSGYLGYCSIVGLNIQTLWKIEAIIDDAHSIFMLFPPPLFISLVSPSCRSTADNHSWTQQVFFSCYLMGNGDFCRSQLLFSRYCQALKKCLSSFTLLPPEDTGWLAVPLLWCRRLCVLWTFILDVKFQRIITPRDIPTRPCSTRLCCQGDSIENYGHSSACTAWAPWM